MNFGFTDSNQNITVIGDVDSEWSWGRAEYIETLKFFPLKFCMNIKLLSKQHIENMLSDSKIYLKNQSRQNRLVVFFKYFIYLFLERGREGDREGEKHQCVVASCAPPTGNLACNPGMCPDQESTQ